jgi:allantoinase
MLSSTPLRPTGPVRDFVGYGRNPPKVEWPGGAKVVVNIVVN